MRLVLPRNRVLLDTQGRSQEEYVPLTPASPASEYTVHACSDFAAMESHVSAALCAFGLPCGCAVLAMSLVLSRGVDRVRQDMDEPVTLVAAPFGHCTQELLNLALTGTAVSNAFNGKRSLDFGEPPAAVSATAGDAGEDSAMCLRGILRRPLVGYLSRLEVLRLAEIGPFYKTPLAPIWVVGSESHFTVLFSPVYGDLRVLEESRHSAVFLAFDRFDTHRGKFIQTTDLEAVLRDAGVLPQVLSSFGGATDALSKAASRMDSQGLGIIPWVDFWSVLRPILERTGTRAGVAARSMESASKPPSATDFDLPALRRRLTDALDREDACGPGGGSGMIALADGALDRVLESLGLPGRAQRLHPARWATALAFNNWLCKQAEAADGVIMAPLLEAALLPLLQEIAAATVEPVAASPTHGGTGGSDRSLHLVGSKRARPDSIGSASGTGGPGVDIGKVDLLAAFRSGKAAAASESSTTLVPVAPVSPLSASVTAPAPAAEDREGPRKFLLMHWNGLQDRGRQPRATLISVTQFEDDIRAMGSGGCRSAGSSVPQQGFATASTARADDVIDLTGGSRSNSGSISSTTVTFQDDEEAAMAAAIQASMETSKLGTDDTGFSGQSTAEDSEIASAIAASLASPTASTGSSTSQTLASNKMKAADVFTDILRTKWHSVAVSFIPEPPSID
jgi:hypothetical protein